MAELFPTPKLQMFEIPGSPLPGGLLYAYVSGASTTPQPTYHDSLGVEAHANPIILDAGGYAVIWLDPDLTYRFVLTDADGTEIWTEDDIQACQD